ncbi:hypothetical protein AAE478_000677 [Parahypoxylon ruwenzoriense]
MNEAQKLAMRLSAAGDAASTDGKGLYLLRIEEDEDGSVYDLIERRWTEFDITDSIVASGMRKAGSAPYLLDSDDQRIIFYADDANELKASTYDTDGQDPQWSDASAEGLSAAVMHEKGLLSACIAGDATLVFFQNPTGNIACIQGADGKWSLAGELPIQVPEGAPHYPLVVGTRLYFFYVGTDHNLHGVTRDAGSTAWNGNTLGKPVSRFVVAYDQDNELLVAYVLAGGVLTSIDEKGNRQDLVREKPDGSGEFEAITTAERAIHLHFHGNNNHFDHFVIGGGVVGHGRSRHRHRRW